MPAKAPLTNTSTEQMMGDVANCIRQRRLSLGVSAAVAAHAAGMSRVTWHRIEKAAPSVTMAAYLSALDAMGLDLTLKPTGGLRIFHEATTGEPGATDEVIDVPENIAIEDYPQLRQIAWHVKDNFELTQAEAYNLYERNSRHLDLDQMPAHELKLLKALQRSAMKGLYAI